MPNLINFEDTAPEEDEVARAEAHVKSILDKLKNAELLRTDALRRKLALDKEAYLKMETQRELEFLKKLETDRNARLKELADKERAFEMQMKAKEESDERERTRQEEDIRVAEYNLRRMSDFS